MAAAALPDPREDGQSLYGEVARVFRQSCIRCHFENGIQDTLIGVVRLNSYDAILAGGVRIVVIPGPAEIDGAAFVATGETRIDDRPSVGQQAKVRARIAPYGSLVAERLRDR